MCMYIIFFCSFFFCLCFIIFFFFFNDTSTTEIYTLSLHDALPICIENMQMSNMVLYCQVLWAAYNDICWVFTDRKSTRLKSSHLGISYAVFCLKKKKKNKKKIINI